MEAAWGDYRERRGLVKKRPSHAFFRWKKEHDWEERVRAFDSEVTGVVVERQAEAIKAATNRMFDSAEEVAEVLVLMALGEVEADKARIMACRDILDRVGVTRKRAESAQARSIGQQNNQYNFDFAGADLNTLVQLADLLDD